MKKTDIKITTYWSSNKVPRSWVISITEPNISFKISKAYLNQIKLQMTQHGIKEMEGKIRFALED